SPDGDRLLTRVKEDEARLWDTATGKTVGEPLRGVYGKEAGDTLAAFSPDGKRLLIGSPDRTARLWDTVTSNPIGQPLAHGEEIKEVDYSPDGKPALTAGKTATRLWDAATGQALGEPIRTTDQWGAGFSPDGQVVFIQSYRSIQLFSTATRAPRGP